MWRICGGNYMFAYSQNKAEETCWNYRGCCLFSHKNPRSWPNPLLECLLQPLLFFIEHPFPKLWQRLPWLRRMYMCQEWSQLPDLYFTSEQVDSSHYQCLWRWQSGSIWNSDWCAETGSIMHPSPWAPPSCSSTFEVYLLCWKGI